MKKRLLAILLSLVLILSLLSAAVFAVTEQITDENGVTVSYEITSAPRNGIHYVEGENIGIVFYITNGTSETLTNVGLSYGDGGTSLANPLEPGQTSSRIDVELPVQKADVDAGEKIVQIDYYYFLNERPYEYTAIDNRSFPAGPVIPVATGLSALRKDGALHVSFESNFNGTYAYLCLKDGESAPEDWSGYSKSAVTEGSNSFTVPDASSEWTKICLMLWDENGDPLQTAPIEASVSDYVMTLEEGFNALTETTTLPYSAQVDLGGEGAVLYYIAEDDNYTFAELLKVEVGEDQQLDLRFTGVNGDIDTVIEIYQESGGSFQKLTEINHDRLPGYGEESAYITPGAGTYYLVFRGHQATQTGLFDLAVGASDAPAIMTLEEGFNALTETTMLPYSAQVDLGGEGAVLYYIADFDGDGYIYAELLKVDLKQGDILNMNFSSADGSYCNTYLEIYQKTEDGYQFIEYFDETGLNGGEAALYTVPADSTYYLAFEGYNIDAVGLCRLEVKTFSPGGVVTNQLDFTQEPVPTPSEGDLWSWDADSKTLTLKDGFFLCNEDYSLDEMIVLPDGATVVVEGSAQIYNAGWESIVSEGNLTIRGAGRETSRLEILYDESDAIDASGDLLVEDCGLVINADSDVLDASGGITLRNVSLEAVADNDVVDANLDVRITGSTLSVSNCDDLILGENVWIESSTLSVSNCDDLILGDNVWIESSTITAGAVDTLVNNNGNVFLTGSDISVAEADVGADIGGTLTVDGGSFAVAFYGGGIDAQKIVFRGDLEMNLQGLRSSSKLMYTSGIEVSLGRDIRLYDGNETVLYEGPWDPTLFDADNYMIMVDGTPAARMETVHEHVYDQQVTDEAYLASPATCTEPARYYYSCTCGEKGTETFAYGEALGHTYKDGVCTVCGAADPDYEAPFAPEIIEGAGGVWQKGGKDGLSFTSNAEYADFLKVQVDGKDVDAADYEVKEGSTIVTLKASYLETLSVGTHTLAVISRSGTAITTFTITAAQTGGDNQTGGNQNSGNQNSGNQTGSNVQTGDSSNLGLWIALLVVAAIGLAVVVILSVKRRNGKRGTD